MASNDLPTMNYRQRTAKGHEMPLLRRFAASLRRRFFADHSHISRCLPPAYAGGSARIHLTSHIVCRLPLTFAEVFDILCTFRLPGEVLPVEGDNKNK
jgi:hypothetical protein